MGWRAGRYAAGAAAAAIAAVAAGAALYLLDDSVLESGRDIRVPESLAGYNVIITGSTRGIGLATAKEFCRLGARVVVSGRAQRAAEAAAREVQAAASPAGRGAATPLAVDLANFSDVRRFVGAVTSELEKVDVLILNAAVSVPGEGGRGTGGMYAANFLGHFLLAELLLERLAPGAAVVSLSSYGMFHGIYEAMMSLDVFGAVAAQGLGYHSSKLALMCYTRSLRRRLAGRSHVQMLVPGRVATDLHHGAQHLGGHLYLWFAPPSRSGSVVLRSAFASVTPTPDVLYAFWFPKWFFQRYVPISQFPRRFEPSIFGPTWFDLAEYFQRLTYGRLHSSVGPECGPDLQDALWHWSANQTQLQHP